MSELVFAAAGAVALVDLRHRGGELCIAETLIEQVALGAALDQMLELLLTVDLDQHVGEFAQRLNRHHLPVDVGARAAVRADHPAHEDLAVVLDRLRLEPAQRACGRVREACRDLGALGAVAHHIPGAPASGDEQQGIDHDRLAGPGLPGERGETGAEFELGLIDDHEIAQLEMREHAVRPPG